MFFGADIPLPAQLGIALPPCVALVYLIKWILQRLEKAEADKDALYDKVLMEVMPAIKEVTELGKMLLANAEADRREREYRGRRGDP